ncbi:DUF1178 family protein [Bartonella tamiae]|uniref:Uncharacterized protein n=1 Tax=Bartonella tamiae Th239 TaxID=1094558 RepID=J0QWS4_9HYPH|nr:DUF1178 family protein [Bartonella tamiae]EJF90461.1 hypothetical protein ME5_00862 [Bartonella tamiae Th239]EJF93595.1 hypothetical protein MEG_01019 [Bartonella tamiae Th307]
MIRFALHCHQAHEFDGWFRNNEDFVKQKNANQIACPQCGSHRVDKVLMAPAVKNTKQNEPIYASITQKEKELITKIHAWSRQVRQKADNVGDRFAEEARRIHFGETSARSIYGQATADDVSSLLDDGVDILPLPHLPEDKN